MRSYGKYLSSELTNEMVSLVGVKYKYYHRLQGTQDKPEGGEE